MGYSSHVFRRCGLRHLINAVAGPRKKATIATAAVGLVTVLICLALTSDCRRNSNLDHPASSSSRTDVWGRSPEGHHEESGGYLAACLLAKDEHLSVNEWLLHHKQRVGISKVYLLDNGSSPPLNETILQHINSGFVHYAWYMPDKETLKGANQQLFAYDHCLHEWGGQHKFMAFIDADEYLLMTGEDEDVPALLKRLQSVAPIGGLVVPWRMIGTSGHETPPKEGVLRSYTHCWEAEPQAHVKSIVNTAHASHAVSPHNFRYQEPYYAINTKFERVDVHASNFTEDYVTLYHYVLRSKQEFRQKVERGAGDKSHKSWKFFEDIERGATSICDRAAKLSPLI